VERGLARPGSAAEYQYVAGRDAALEGVVVEKDHVAGSMTPAPGIADYPAAENSGVELLGVKRTRQEDSL
jgi:hypothetical protein